MTFEDAKERLMTPEVKAEYDKLQKEYDEIRKQLANPSPWHTGIPTEEGWYLIEAKDWERQRVYYVPDYVSVHDLVLPTVQSFYESHLWQKIELSDEAKDLEQKKTPFETSKEN